MSRKQKYSGFTLIEVLLAMTLLSIMVVLLFSSLRVGAESWNKGENKIAAVNEKAVVYQFFKRHIPSVLPLEDDFSEEHSQFSFQGEQSKLKFVSVFPASSGRKGLQQFEIIFTDEQSGVIKIILKPFFPVLEEDSWKVEEVILIENVESFQIAYFGKAEDVDEGEWRNNWQEQESLPLLVKIKIGMLDHSYWPEMVFALELASKGPNAPALTEAISKKVQQGFGL